MANGSLTTRQQKKGLMYRGYTSSPTDTQYDPPTKFTIGINGTTPSENNTDLVEAIPISDGTVNDNGSTNLTGSSGGDNSTDNTTTYKEGAGESDNTAQNLIANDTNATKIWTIAALSTNITATQPVGLWIYIKDATALAKFVSLEIKLGSDSSNYYSLSKTAAQLSTGWNWVNSGSTNVEDLTETGTVSGDIDTFIIEIVTNNATDEFVAGDVVYDLLRQWEDSDLLKLFNTGYPSLNLTNLEVSMKCTLLSNEGNGFLVDSIGTKNVDGYLMDIHVQDDESKSSTDEFIYTIKNRMI